MYEDEDIWPIRCPHCGHGLTTKIRHLKSGVVTKCVGCSNELGHSTGEFHRALSQARRGKLNPWWDMLRTIAHYSHGTNVTQVGHVSQTRH
jgi:DNA-directed RNA polymerase subunit N (RpoN/RPB10)